MIVVYVRTGNVVRSGLSAVVLLGLANTAVTGNEVRASITEWGYVRLGDLLRYVVGNPGMVLHTSFPRREAVAFFSITKRLGFRRWWFRYVYGDPETQPVRAGTGIDILRNIAYIHAVKQYFAAPSLRRFRMSGYRMGDLVHAILRVSGYSAETASMPKDVLEKLPRIRLAEPP